MSDPIKPRQTFSTSSLLQNNDEAVEAQPLDAAKSFTGSQEFQALSETVQETTAVPVLEKSVTQPSLTTWLGRFAVAGFGILLLVEMALMLWQTWQQSPWLFGLYALVVGASSLWLGAGIVKEFRSLRRYKQVDSMQTQGQRLRASMQFGEASRFIHQLQTRLPQTKAFVISQQHNDAEQLILFEKQILIPIDEQAQRIVSRYATEAALMLAASPVAVLDMALILWRNQRMISELAQHYGIELGYWSRIRLFRHVLANVIYSGATELAIDLSSQALSMELTSKLSARLAQGLGGGLLTARLGYKAMALCRPLTFTEQSRPKLSQVHQHLLTTIQSYAFERKNAEALKTDGEKVE